MGENLNSTLSLKNLSSKVLLVILDGFGQNPKDLKNAIKAAKKPHIDNLFSHYPFTTITAGGISVGLPKGVAGNSEVGHINIGAGRPVRQDLVRINEAISNHSLGSLPKMHELIEFSKNHSKRIHLMGLLSDGGVHSHINHIKEVIKILSQDKDIKIYFHAFMDGRDTQQDKGKSFIEDLKKVPGFVFASIQGRSIGMDRDRRWEKIERAYKMMIGHGEKSKLTPEEYIQAEYDKKIYDEFITPALLNDEGKIQKEDAVFFLNFRPDRARQLTLCFTGPKFKEFPTPIRPAYYLCMSPYVPDEVNLPILFDKEKVKGGLAEYLSKVGKKQFKIAETEKYAHVTYFFNGGEEKLLPGEERILVPSPKEVKTYDEKPEMSAYEVLDKLIKELDSNKFDFYLVNFANSDMVGHTGNFSAAVKAIETLDTCVGKLMEKCAEKNITMILTADHGNSDQMIYEDGSPHTSHTDAPVPFGIFSPKLVDKKLVTQDGDLALKDIAPTILNIMGLEKPATMVGLSIFT